MKNNYYKKNSIIKFFLSLNIVTNIFLMYVKNKY